MANIGYIRVSTDAQNTARQDDLFTCLAVDKIFREKMSGATADRPQLKAMLDYVREGDVVHVESISRLARSTRDLLTIVGQLQEKSVQFVSHKEAIDTTTPQGRFVLTIFGALAELERETTAQRRDEGIESAKKRGVKFGRPRAARPDGIEKTFEAIQRREMTCEQGANKNGMKRSTFYIMYRDWREAIEDAQSAQ